MKKVTALILAVIFVLSLVPAAVFADVPEYTAVDVHINFEVGKRLSDLDVRIFATTNADLSNLTDRTSEFNLLAYDGVYNDGAETSGKDAVLYYEWFSEPEDGVEYDKVNEDAHIYAKRIPSDTVIEKNHNYGWTIPSITAKNGADFDIWGDERALYNGKSIVTEYGGMRGNTGNDLLLTCFISVEGAPDYQASGWALTWVEQADELGLIPECLDGVDLAEPITRKEFAAVAVKIYEGMTGKTAVPVAVNPFTDCDDIEVLKAYNVGITNGAGSATTFVPDVVLNREQCATMLTRVYKKTAISGWTLETDGNYTAQFKSMFKMPAKFADDKNISSWASDSVYFMKASGIIDGVGNNNFAPQHGMTKNEAKTYGIATREQALKMAVGMVKTLK